MSEFEWRSEMRKLSGAVEPARDLWPTIEARIAALPNRRSRRPLIFSMAAGLLVACGAMVFAWRLHTTAPVESPAVASTTAVTNAPNKHKHARADLAQPAHPVLAAASLDLDDASADIQEALEQRPDAVFLVGLLNRTNGQRMRLLKQSYAG
jgi:hypothetical protein